MRQFEFARTVCARLLGQWHLRKVRRRAGMILACFSADDAYALSANFCTSGHALLRLRTAGVRLR
ncbi:MAG: hypothetical protein WBN29_17160, partial [Polyangiales bacterium]